MTSLSEILGCVLTLPKEELLPGKTEAERPQEMSILGTIVSKEQIASWRQKGVIVQRRCLVCDGAPGLNFRITNGETHDVVATYSTDRGVQVSDNRDNLSIDTIEGLYEHIERLATK